MSVREAATLPGFTAEAALGESSSRRHGGGPAAVAGPRGTVIPAAFPIGCYIGEYVRCRTAGAPQSACDDLALKTCVARMLGGGV